MTSRDATGDTSSNGRDVQAIDIIDPSQLEVVSITLAPTDPIITVDPASAPHPTQAFMVTGQRRDGTMATGLAALWSLVPAGSGAVDPNLVGAINETTGVFTASGSAGGEIRVQAAVATQSGMVMASTSLTVLIHATVLVNGAPPDVMSHFAGAAMTDPARQADVAYPLDQSVMPQNVYPADIQWNNGAAGDDFRITMRKPHANVIAYLHAESGFTNDYLVEQTVWRQLAQTDVGDSMSITVDRYEAATSQVITSPPVNMRFANGAVAGTIYYWDIAAGQARRIDDGTATRTTPIPTPPTSPDDASNCMGCHAVSRDGRYFAGRLGGGGNNRGVIFDLTTDLSAAPAPSLYPINEAARWSYASFSPDSTRLVTDNYTTAPTPRLQVLDPMNGTVVTPNIGLGTQPSWSPDGRTIAFVAVPAGTWGGEFSAGQISTLPVTGPDAYGSPTMLHDGASLAAQPETGAADSYPSWTPDSHWLAFSHGDVSRSDTGRGAIYLIGSTPGSAAVRLDRATGGASSADNFFPNFSPFDSGGYFWLSFLSRRDYGNASAGTRGAHRQQIWVTAVRHMPDGSTDPSEVAYWLPGQDTHSANISAFWAPRPCRRDSEGCAVSSECCSGICRDDGTGHGTCQPPPMSMCHTAYQPCGGGGCCEGLVCISNICSPPPG